MDFARVRLWEQSGREMPQPITPAQGVFRTGLPAGGNCLARHEHTYASSQEDQPTNGPTAPLRIK